MGKSIEILIRHRYTYLQLSYTYKKAKRDVKKFEMVEFLKVLPNIVEENCTSTQEDMGILSTDTIIFPWVFVCFI